MDATTLLLTAFFSFLPISELRGAIPLALAKGMSPLWAYLYCVTLNALVAPVCWIFLNTVHKLLEHVAWYRAFFDRFVDKAREKVKPSVERWGWMGIAAFVAVPLPITGAWTGTMGAWVLGLSKRKTFAAVAIGVAVAGLIVTAVVLLGVSALNFLVKRV